MKKLANVSHFNKIAVRRSKGGAHLLRKEQYIAAYVEAKSDAISQSLSLRKSYADLPPVKSPKELDDLAVELSQTYRMPSTRGRLSSSGEDALVEKGTTAFGSWREPSGVVSMRSRSADFIFHQVIREGKTPVALSPASLQRTFADVPAVQKFDHYLLRLSRPRGGAAQAPQISVQRLGEEIERVVSAHKTGGVRGEDTALLRCYCVQRMCELLGWAVAVAYLKRCIGAREGVTRDEKASLIGALCECVRETRRAQQDVTDSVSSISVGELSSLCEAFFPPSVTGAPPLPPVAAAPLLSVLSFGEACVAGGGLSLVQDFANRFLIHRGRQGLQYLPAIAWGEYIRACWRFGASAAELQSLVDRVTDPKCTKNAEALLTSPRVWSAYLYCCDSATHALEVYRNNLPHYKVTPLPCITTSVISCLTRSKNPRDAETALELWGELRRTETQYVIGSTSLFVSLCKAFHILDKEVDFFRLLVDFNAFLVYFKVDYDWWENNGGARMLQYTESVLTAESAVPFRAFFLRAVEEYGHDCIPMAISNEVLKTISLFEERKQKDSSKVSNTLTADLTAESLSDLLL